MLNTAELPEESYEMIPDGAEVPLIIQLAENVQSQNTPKCWMIRLTNLVVSGAYKGKKFMTYGVHEHPTKPRAILAGRALLRSLFTALDIESVNENDPMSLFQLCGKPLVGKIKLQKASGEYGESNSVRAYKSANTEEGKAVFQQAAVEEAAATAQQAPIQPSAEQYSQYVQAPQAAAPAAPAFDAFAVPPAQPEAPAPTPQPGYAPPNAQPVPPAPLPAPTQSSSQIGGQAVDDLPF